MKFYTYAQAGHLFFSEGAVYQDADSEMTLGILNEMKVEKRLKQE